MSEGAENCVTLARCESRMSASAGWLEMVVATSSDEYSSFSIGLTLLTTTVSMREEAKEWVAAMMTCRVTCSRGRVPERERASSRSNAFSVSFRCSSACL